MGRLEGWLGDGDGTIVLHYQCPDCSLCKCHDDVMSHHLVVDFGAAVAEADSHWTLVSLGPDCG